MSENSPKKDIDDPVYRTSPLQQAVASCTGALLTSFLMTPLDVVKIRLQVQQRAEAKCFLYCNGLMDHICGCAANENNGNKQWFKRPGHFNGTFDAFIKIARNEGLTSLWSGLSPTLILAVPATIAYFVTYEQLRLKLRDEYNKRNNTGEPLKQPLWIPLASGASARIISCTLVSPLELVRTKMQSAKLSYLEVGAALKMLVKQDGVTGLWKGLFSTLLRDVPFSAIYWMNYETIKSFFGSGTPSFGVSFLAGAISGSVAATLTVPFDVVKTHQQIEFGERALFSDQPKKTQGVRKIFRSVYQMYGIRGLFAGLTPRLIKVAPACAIMISTFEYSKVAISRLANKSNYNSISDENHYKSSDTVFRVDVKSKKSDDRGIGIEEEYEYEYDAEGYPIIVPMSTYIHY